MGQFDYQRTVIAYHGCDQSVVDAVLLNGVPLQQSKKDYEWLGRGSYFGEHGPQRALEWAGDPRKKIKMPAVLGAILNLGNCFDLLDTRHTALLKGMFPEFCRVQNEKSIPIPENESPWHKLDCAVINWTIEKLESRGGQKYHTVRGVFLEGERAFAGSTIKGQSHIQIAVRHPEAIVGFFKPAIDSTDGL